MAWMNEQSLLKRYMVAGLFTGLARASAFGVGVALPYPAVKAVILIVMATHTAVGRSNRRRLPCGKPQLLYPPIT